MQLLIGTSLAAATWNTIMNVSRTGLVEDARSRGWL